MSRIAEEIIQMRDRERDKQQGFWWGLWQDAADLCYPNEDQINKSGTPGEDQSVKRHDSTAILDSQDMASGLSAALIPTGQKFFTLKLKNRALGADRHIALYLLMAAEVVHEELFESNFMLHFNETLRSLAVFGTACLYSEWDQTHGGLNFKDHAINLYQIKEDARGNVDTVILSYKMSARQAVEEFGEDAVSTDIREAAASFESESKKFKFIHIVRPRTKLNPLLKDNRNMPWESVYVDEKAQEIVRESGYEEMPFSVVRWMKRSNEKYGRGQGTECLADIRMLQKMRKDQIDHANRYCNPPYLVDSSFEGDLDVRPNAVNRVANMNSVKGIDQTILGNFPITEQVIAAQQELIHKAFFRDIFVQITDLKGDRRTTVEINARMQEGLRRLASPVMRLQSELLNPVVMRSLMLLIRNGRIPYPPPQLMGQSFGIEYLGQLALALRDQQAKGFTQWAAFIGQVAQIDPSAVDNVSWDRAIPRMGESYGVNSGDMATPEEVAAKREARAKQQAALQAAQAVQVGADAYHKGTKAPEEGSAAGELMTAAKGAA